MKNLLTLKFWLDQQPGLFIPSTQYAIEAFIVILLISIIVFFILGKKKGFYAPLWKRLQNLTVFNVIVLMLLDFFAEELIPFLSIRIWFLIWAIEVAIWVWLIVSFAKKLPVKRDKIAKEKEFKKYLP
jgi:hypothetical protein